jgi:hypothetical protein
MIAGAQAPADLQERTLCAKKPALVAGFLYLYLG